MRLDISCSFLKQQVSKFPSVVCGIQLYMPQISHLLPLNIPLICQRGSFTLLTSSVTKPYQLLEIAS